jgi:hypothetical protein
MYISTDATAKGIMQVGIDSMVPCIFGVLTVMNKEQAIVRSAGKLNIYKCTLMCKYVWLCIIDVRTIVRTIVRTMYIRSRNSD